MKFRMGVIGYGKRGSSVTREILLRMKDVQVIAICDSYEDRVREGIADVGKKEGKPANGYADYREMLEKEPLDGVYIAAAWEYHAEIALEAMRRGVPVALEVGGAYSIESLWRMVRTQEETGTPVMLMENCCFGKDELLVTSMVRGGVFGEIVHCHGAYAHFLGDEILMGGKERHYRLRNYMRRNCENYPTHELSPIAKILNINRGNQMVSLVSVASRAAGLEAYAKSHPEKYGDLIGTNFAQGDIVNTIITCADGSTVSLRLDTTLPRFYSREFTVRGTKGLYEQGNNYVYLTDEPEVWETVEQYGKYGNNAAKYEEDYLPPVWRNITSEDTEAGHGGMDAVEFRVFVDCLKAGKPMPIDIYDAAAWMCVSVLSEASIAQGGAPQAIPDFTDGKWVLREPMDVVELKH